MQWSHLQANVKNPHCFSLTWIFHFQKVGNFRQEDKLSYADPLLLQYLITEVW